MPAFGPNGLGLKPKDLAAVLTYIRQDWGNEASEMAVATVEAYYATYGARSTPWTAEEVVEGLSPESVAASVDAEVAADVEDEAAPAVDPLAYH